MNPSRRPLLTSICLLLFLAPALSYGLQSGGKKHALIVLTKLTAPSSDPVAEHLAGTVTNSVDLTMRLTGTLTVKRADFLVPTAALDRTIPYYQQVNADGAVFGSVVPEKDGSYTIDLEVWNAEHPKKPPVRLRDHIDNLLASFALSDELALKVASTVVRRKLTEGTLVVDNVAKLPKFAVYADGHLLGRNRSSFKVLSGKREIVIAKPGLVGDEPLQVFHVTITKNQTTTIRISPPKRPQTAKQQNQGAASAKSKRGSAASSPIAGRLDFHVTTSEPESNGKIELSGPSGRRTFDFSLFSDHTTPLSLRPGVYTVHASVGDDPGFGYTGTVTVSAGKTVTDDIEVAYSIGYQITKMKETRAAATQHLSEMKRERKKKGRIGTILTVGSIATAGLSVLSYFLGSNAYKSYQAATTVADVKTYRTEASIYGPASIGGGVAAVVGLIWGGVDLHNRPTGTSIQSVQNSIDTLDKQLKILAAKESAQK